MTPGIGRSTRKANRTFIYPSQSQEVAALGDSIDILTRTAATSSSSLPAVSLMNEQIKAQIETKPFQRFFIDINDGRSVEVPHPDHVIVGRFAVTVEDDAGIVRILAYRNISGLTVATANDGEPPLAP